MIEADVEQVAALHATLDHSFWTQSQWLDALKYHPCAWVLQKAEMDNLLGYLIYQTQVPQAELLNIGIASVEQGKGLAYELLTASMSLLPKSTESIFLEVRRSNVPAIGLYEKSGFIKVGERRDYYAVAGGTREDALMYKYEFSPAC